MIKRCGFEMRFIFYLNPLEMMIYGSFVGEHSDFPHLFILFAIRSI